MADLDLELLARWLLAGGEQAVRQVLTDPEEFNVERYGKFVRSLLVRIR